MFKHGSMDTKSLSAVLVTCSTKNVIYDIQIVRHLANMNEAVPYSTYLGAVPKLLLETMFLDSL
jgi:hypothetical protein